MRGLYKVSALVLSSSMCLRVGAFGAWGLVGRGSAVRRPLASRRGSMPDNSGGQDGGELFEVCKAPIALGRQQEAPTTTGERKARRLVHAEGDWHRAVHVWLVNGRGDVVLQRRSALKDTFPDMWDVSVGGHMTAGDGSLETAVKEVEEELGLSVEQGDLKFLFTVATQAEGSTEKHGAFKCNEFKDVYLLRFEGDISDLTFEPGEVTDARWEPIESFVSKQKEGDPTCIPRGQDYVNGLAAAVDSLVKT